MSHRKILGEILFAFGEYYDKRLTPAQIAMYVEDLSVLSQEELTAACRMYRVDAANERFPLPAKLIALVRPQVTAEDVGRETATAIIESVFKHGWTNPEKAREKMGELGWSVVGRLGGWQNFCQDLTNENMTTLRAQIRDLAATMARSTKRETDLSKHGLTHSTGVSELIAKATKVLPGTADV